MPSLVIGILPQDGKLVNLNLSNITDRFTQVFEKLNMHRFRFYDLRYYAASIMHALGIPDVYIMRQGGWSNDATRNAKKEKT